MEGRVLLKVSEAAEILRIGRSHMYRLIEAGRVKTIKLGPKSLRITRSELDRFLASGSDDNPHTV